MWDMPLPPQRAIFHLSHPGRLNTLSTPECHHPRRGSEALQKWASQPLQRNARLVIAA